MTRTPLTPRQLGMLLAVLAAFGFSFKAIFVKLAYLSAPVDAITLLSLRMLFSLPLYALAMWLSGQGFDYSGDQRGLGAIVYLAVFGSLLGFYCYFQVLARLPAATVALVTLITPVLALMLGAALNDELLGVRVLAGAAVIVAALGLYLLGDRRVRRGVVSTAAGDG